MEEVKSLIPALVGSANGEVSLRFEEPATTPFTGGIRTVSRKLIVFARGMSMKIPHHGSAFLLGLLLSLSWSGMALDTRFYVGPHSADGMEQLESFCL